MTQGGGTDAERQRHHRMHGERSLEVGHHVEAVGLFHILRDDGVSLDRRDRVARIADCQFLGVFGFGKGLVRVAMNEIAL